MGRISFASFAGDASPETIAKVRRLYERAGTPGEKQAAAAALERLGAAAADYAAMFLPGSSQWLVRHPVSGRAAYIPGAIARSEAEAIAQAKKPGAVWY